MHQSMGDERTLYTRSIRKFQSTIKPKCALPILESNKDIEMSENISLYFKIYIFFYFFISTPFITEIGKLVVVFRQNDGVSSFCLMVSVSMERILRLGNIESPRSKALVSSFVFGGSTISLQKNYLNQKSYCKQD